MEAHWIEDSWVKQMIAMLDKAMLRNKGVDTTITMPNRGTAEWPVVEGALVPAKVVPLQSEGPIKGACLADVVSTAQPLNVK